MAVSFPAAPGSPSAGREEQVDGGGTQLEPVEMAAMGRSLTSTRVAALRAHACPARADEGEGCFPSLPGRCASTPAT